MLTRFPQYLFFIYYLLKLDIIIKIEYKKKSIKIYINIIKFKFTL